MFNFAQLTLFFSISVCVGVCVCCLAYQIVCIKNLTSRTSLAVQWLRLLTAIAEGAGSIPGQGTKILHARHCGQKEKLTSFPDIVPVLPTIHSFPVYFKSYLFHTWNSFILYVYFWIFCFVPLVCLLSC